MGGWRTEGEEVGWMENRKRSGGVRGEQLKGWVPTEEEGVISRRPEGGRGGEGE